MKRWTKTLCRYRLDHKVCIETVVEHMDRSTSNKTVRDRRWGVETAGARSAAQFCESRATLFIQGDVICTCWNANERKGGSTRSWPFILFEHVHCRPTNFHDLLFFRLIVVLSAWFFFWRGFWWVVPSLVVFQLRSTSFLNGTRQVDTPLN